MYDTNRNVYFDKNMHNERRFILPPSQRYEYPPVVVERPGSVYDPPPPVKISRGPLLVPARSSNSKTGQWVLVGLLLIIIVLGLVLGIGYGVGTFLPEEDPCEESPCQNGGLCRSMGDRVKCLCPSSYLGEYCQISNQCSVGRGTRCTGGCEVNKVTGDFTCTCPRGQHLSKDGFSCEVENKCGEDTCGEHGTCLPLVRDYFCLCEAGYKGKHCDIDIDECQLGVADCDGECRNTPGSYRCSCPEGQRLTANGKRCEDINECSSAPCIHGRCENKEGMFECVCLPGYRGNTCEEDINECDERNGLCEVECVNSPGSYTCTCPAGQTLAPDQRSCNTQNTRECLSNPCVHGTCVEGDETYACVCEAGFTGDMCQKDERFCLSNPCVHGTCVEGSDTYVCVCEAGFTGDMCEIENCDTDAGWLYYRDSGHCYKYFDNFDILGLYMYGSGSGWEAIDKMADPLEYPGLNQKEAQASCEEEGGNLVSINTEGEMTFIQHNILKNAPHATAFLFRRKRSILGDKDPRGIFGGDINLTPLLTLWSGLQFQGGSPRWTDDSSGFYYEMLYDGDESGEVPEGPGVKCAALMRLIHDQEDKGFNDVAVYPCDKPLPYLCEKPSGGYMGYK